MSPSKIRYYKRMGFTIPELEIFKKTEEGICYAFPGSIAKLFGSWSGHQRKIKEDYSFARFYNQLAPDQQKQITTTQINY
jgi:hypothetical protein